MVADDRPCGRQAKGWPARERMFEHVFPDDIKVWCGCTLSKVVPSNSNMDRKNEEESMASTAHIGHEFMTQNINKMGQMINLP